jgi:hypothetical protein
MIAYRLPLIAAIVAIFATASMDYAGYAQFSALILFPLVVIFWFILRPGRREWGLVIGKPGDYGLAVLYPLFAIGGLALLTLLVGATSTVETDWNKTLINMAAVGISTIIVASVSHGVWNGMVYLLFGLGEGGGALGITDTILYGPERGVLGLVFNGAYVFFLWKKARASG